MSQKNVDFMKKNTYQLKKQMIPPDNIETLRSVQELFNGQMDGTETFFDADMPVIALEAELDWSKGLAPNDEIFRATKEKVIVEEDLQSGVYEPITDLSGFLPRGTGFNNAGIGYRAIIDYKNTFIIAGTGGKVYTYDLFTDTLITDGSAISNDGTSTGLFDILDILNLNDELLIFVGESDKISTYDLVNETWNNYNSGAPYTNSSTGLTGFSYGGFLDGDTLIVYGTAGVGSFDGTAWKYYDGTGTGTGIYQAFPYDWPGEGVDHCSNGYRYQNFNIFCSDAGWVFSHDGTDWKLWDGTGTGTGPYHAGFNEYMRVISEYEGSAVFVTTDSRTTSWNLASGWKDFDGTGTGTGISNDISTSGNCFQVVEYKGDLIYCDNQFGYFDGTERVFYDGYTSINKYNGELALNSSYGHVVYNDSIYLVGSAETFTTINKADDGTIGIYQKIIGESTTTNDFLTRTMPTGLTTLADDTVTSSIKYGDFLVFGCNSGDIFYYDTVGETWHGYDDAGTGPNDDGTALGGNRVYKMVVFDGYLVIADSTGRIASFFNGTWYPYNTAKVLDGKNYFSDQVLIGGQAPVDMVVLPAIAGDILIIVSLYSRVASIGLTSDTSYLSVKYGTTDDSFYWLDPDVTRLFATTSPTVTAVGVFPQVDDNNFSLVLADASGEIASLNTKYYQWINYNGVYVGGGDWVNTNQISKWLFEGVTTDETGNNDGTLPTGTLTYSDMIGNRDSGIITPSVAEVTIDAVPFTTVTTKISVTAWVRINQATDSTYEVFIKEGGNTNGWWLGCQNGNFNYGFNSSAAHFYYTQSFATLGIEIGQWNFIAFTVDLDNDRIRFYHNDNAGIETAFTTGLTTLSGTGSAALFSNVTSVLDINGDVGSHYTKSASFGRMEVHNTELSDADIGTIFSEGEDIADNVTDGYIYTSVSGAVFGLIPQKGQLIAKGNNDVVSCSAGNDWTSINSYNQNPYGFYGENTSFYQPATSTKPLSWDETNPDFEFYHSRPQNFHGDDFSNEVTDSEDLTLAGWSEVDVDNQIYGGKILGNQIYGILSTNGVDSCYTENTAFVSANATEKMVSVVGRRGNTVTHPDTFMSLYNSTTAQDVARVEIDYSTQSAVATIGTMVKATWWDDETVEIYCLTGAGLISTSDSLSLRLGANLAANYNYSLWLRPLVYDNRDEVLHPWAENGSLSKALARDFTISNKFVFDVEFEPTSDYYPSVDKGIWSYRIDSTHFMKLFYYAAARRYYFYWNDGGALRTITGWSSSPDDAYFQRKTRIIGSIDLSQTDSRHSFFTVIYPETREVVPAYSATAFTNISVMSSTFDFLFIGTFGNEDEFLDGNFDSLRIYNDLQFPESSRTETIEYWEENLPERKILFYDTYGRHSSFVGNDYFESTSLEGISSDTTISSAHDLSTAVYDGDKGVHLLGDVGTTSNDVITIDTKTGSFSLGEDKIYYRK